jgi:hypothetical protein
LITVQEVVLVERIALALLEARGCDTAALEALPSSSDGLERDALAAWERAQVARGAR